MKKILFVLGVCILLTVSLFSGCEDTQKEITQMSINTFIVEPSLIESGQTANLSWTVIGATSISIDYGIGTVSLMGSRIIAPTETTTYTLTASNATRTISATTQIIVQDDTTPPLETPTIQFVMDETLDRLVIASISPQVAWTDLAIRFNQAVRICINGEATPTVGTDITADVLHPIVIADLSGGVAPYYISASDFIDVEGGTAAAPVALNNVRISIVHLDSGTTLGTYTMITVVAINGGTTPPQETPTIQFTVDESLDRLVVATTSPQVAWTDLAIRSDQAIRIRINGEVTTTVGTDMAANALHAIVVADIAGGAANVQASDFIDFEGTNGALTNVRLSIVHTDTGTTLGTYTIITVAAIS